MRGPRPILFRAGIILGAALMLQGCLAAAIPVLAGSALATRDVIDDGFARSSKSEPEKVVTVDSSAAQELVTTAPTSTVTPANPSSKELSEAGQRWEVLKTDILPAPTGNGALSSTPRGPAGLAGLASYAVEKATPGVIRSDITSAVLANPAALDGERAPCKAKPFAVLIDLDPEGGLVPVEGVAKADESIVTQLDILRRNDITIGWISGRFADDASNVREALATSALDPLAQDTLLLMRYADDRKQARRQEFAEDYCLVAMAGDNRSDFDELYEFIKNPDLALAIEPLFGDGWFLTPSPLIQE